MAEGQNDTGLQIDQDLDFQRREWAVQRIAGVLLILVILMALLGLFGSGPLSSASASDPDRAVTVGYERFVRHGGQTTLTVQVDSDRASDGEIALWLSTDYLDKVELQTISPEPREVRGADDRLIYVFAVDDLTTSFEARFSFQPSDMGRFQGEAGLEGDAGVRFTQLGYP